jgi:hypothetical protein
MSLMREAEGFPAYDNQLSRCSPSKRKNSYLQTRCRPQQTAKQVLEAELR